MERENRQQPDYTAVLIEHNRYNTDAAADNRPENHTIPRNTDSRAAGDSGQQESCASDNTDR